MSEFQSKDREVKKHAATIHCSNALSLLQRKISNVLLYYAYKELSHKEEHVISVREICQIMGLSTHNYDALKEALRALVRTVLEWNVVDDKTGDEDWSATTVLASVRLKAGSCYYAYSPRMRELLYSPSVYGKINLVIQSRFKSSYALALYENCVRYKNVGGSKWFNMDEFRKIMGVSDSQYPIFRDLKRRVIDKAVDEVNTYADIVVSPEYKRVGRKVQGLKFLVKERAKMPRLNQGSEDKQNKKAALENNIIFHQLIKDFGVNEPVARLLLKDFSVEYIQEKIQLTLTSSSYKTGKINDLAGYIVAAIRNDFQKNVSAQTQLDEQREIENQTKVSEQNNKKQQEKIEKQYSEYIKSEFLSHLNQIEEGTQKSIIEQWIAQLTKSSSFINKRIKRLYQEQGFSHPLAYISFKDYLAKNHSELYPKFLSFEDFKTK